MKGKKVLSGALSAALILGSMSFTAFANENILAENTIAVYRAAPGTVITADYSWYDADASEYTISNAAQLLGLANIVNGTATGITQSDFSGKKITLAADIDLTGVEWTPIGGLDASFDFKGEFDGASKKISNLTMTLGDQGSNKVRMGLFASLMAKVHDLTLETVNFSVNGSNVRAGALGGNVFGQGGIVHNVTVNGFTFTGSSTGDGALYVGGLGGRCYDPGATGQGKLKDNVIKNVNITASGCVYAGGVSGYNSGYFDADNTDVQDVTIDVTATSESYVGGVLRR